MSQSSQSSLKEHFQETHHLISQQRYGEARQLLKQLDHPQAKVWLKQLEGKTVSRKRSRPQTGLILFGVLAIIGFIFLILALMYAPRLLEAMQPNTYEQYLDDTVASDEEILYANVASYCYHITDYGGELCLDWTDMLLADYQTIVTACFEPYLETVLLEDEDYIVIRECLSDDIPSPY